MPVLSFTLTFSRVHREIGFEIVRQLYRQNFDPAFTSKELVFWVRSQKGFHASRGCT